MKYLKLFEEIDIGLGNEVWEEDENEEDVIDIPEGESDDFYRKLKGSTVVHKRDDKNDYGIVVDVWIDEGRTHRLLVRWPISDPVVLRIRKKYGINPGYNFAYNIDDLMLVI